MAEERNKLDALNRENEISELFRIVQSASINRAFCSFAIEGTWGVGKTFILERLEEKLEFFGLLVKIGFKEIEVGFPAASETEYEFLRTIIEDHLIPEDVSIQVLTQSRPHIIQKTFEAIKGAKNVVVHLYNSTSFAQRQQVFRSVSQ